MNTIFLERLDFESSLLVPINVFVSGGSFYQLNLPSKAY